MDLAGSLRPDAADALEVFFARLRQGFDRAEVAQQVAALGRTDAGDPVQLGGEKSPASEIAVIRNREAMGLVSDEIGRATSELQSQSNLVCRLLLEKKKKKNTKKYLRELTTNVYR